MTKALSIIAIYVFTTIWCYAFGAFTVNEPNVFEWNAFGRALVMYVPLAVTAIFYVAVWSTPAVELREKRKKGLIMTVKVTTSIATAYQVLKLMADYEGAIESYEKDEDSIVVEFTINQSEIALDHDQADVNIVSVTAI